LNRLSEAEDLVSFLKLLKEEQGDSFRSLEAKTGIASSSLARISHGGKADDATLDKLADYAGVSREYMYQLAKGLKPSRRRSPVVALVAALLEELPQDIQDAFLIQARAYADIVKKRSQKSDKESD
jgi:transcriptional regulator with XRE-family HTH domain